MNKGLVKKVIFCFVFRRGIDNLPLNLISSPYIYAARAETFNPFRLICVSEVHTFNFIQNPQIHIRRYINWTNIRFNNYVQLNKKNALR